MKFLLALDTPSSWDIVQLDIIHLGLLGLCALLLLIALFRGGSKQTKNIQVEQELPSESSEDLASEAPKLLAMNDDGALQLLALFQSEGRLVDFIREDMAAHSDSDIGAAARVVHKGLRQVFDEHFEVAAIINEEEGEPVTVEQGFKPTQVQLLGQVSGDGPFKGTLVHQGWAVTDIRLPKVVEGRDSRVLAPAQVEL